MRTSSTHFIRPARWSAIDFDLRRGCERNPGHSCSITVAINSSAITERLHSSPTCAGITIRPPIQVPKVSLHIPEIVAGLDVLSFHGIPVPAPFKVMQHHAGRQGRARSYHDDTQMIVHDQIGQCSAPEIRDTDPTIPVPRCSKAPHRPRCLRRRGRQPVCRSR